jgi:hypothetical protein
MVKLRLFKDLERVISTAEIDILEWLLSIGIPDIFELRVTHPQKNAELIVRLSQ